MNKKNIKVIMYDLDGTLLNDAGFVNPETIKQIKLLKEKGILFGIATGREIDSCEDLYEEWGIKGLIDMIVGSNGAHIKDYCSQLEKIHHPLSGKDIKEIIHYFDGMDVNFSICYQGCLQMKKDDETARFLSKVDKIPMKVVDYEELLQIPHTKLMVICKQSMMAEVEKRGAMHKNERFVSMCTAPILYEYSDARNTKSNGLRHFLEAYSWDMENVMFFGDANNDLDLISHSGVGICMKNGSEEAKKCADYISEEDNNHNGIALFLSKYFTN
ncbi:MAG: Cof-type HAD-IIB family hydrolase [Longicatena sp.]